MYEMLTFRKSKPRRIRVKNLLCRFFQTVDKVANAKVFATFLLSKNYVGKCCPFLNYDWNLNICKGIYGIINHRIFNEVPSNDD